MIIEDGLPFINNYVDTINQILRRENKKLSRLQAAWLKFVLSGIIITNTVCWAQFASYSISAISWMFRRAKLPWNRLLLVSVKYIILKYKIKSCSLVIDDSDRGRSKNTTKIAKVHKLKDKLTGGYKFYEPDQKLQAYNREDKRLRAKGVAKKYRPIEPARSKDYPTTIDLSLELLKDFTTEFPTMKISSTSADAAYGTRHFVEKAAAITKQKQVITQIKSTQNIMVHKNNMTMSVAEFFKNYHGITTSVQLRGQNKIINFVSCKLKVKSHDATYRVVALKYEKEADYRYIIANDASWQAINILQAYALRWLVEVFIQDWKSHEWWNQLAKQPGIDGEICD